MYDTRSLQTYNVDITRFGGLSIVTHSGKLVAVAFNDRGYDPVVSIVGQETNPTQTAAYRAYQREYKQRKKREREKKV